MGDPSNNAVGPCAEQETPPKGNTPQSFPGLPSKVASLQAKPNSKHAHNNIPAQRNNATTHA